MGRESGTYLLTGLLLGAALLAGCGDNEAFLTEDRLSNGLVIILPGIEGVSDLNRNIRRGLIAGGVYQALPIHSWGRPIPLAGVLLNQMDFIGNRLAGVSVADLIVNYQDSYPGRPVHIVGHSGGGGVAVFAAEALPEGRKIQGLILLSASISSGYDLEKAASRCSKGIVNFYNPDDVGLLGIGTTIVGNVDGVRGPSAGLTGFDRAGQPGHLNVYPVKLSGADPGGDPHTSTTRVGFVSANIAPWIHVTEWPAGPQLAYLGDSRWYEELPLDNPDPNAWAEIRYEPEGPDEQAPPVSSSAPIAIAPPAPPGAEEAVAALHPLPTERARADEVKPRRKSKSEKQAARRLRRKKNPPVPEPPK